MMNEDSQVQEKPWPAPRRGWLLVGLLALASVVSQFDRTVINLMVGPIKAEFGLSDTAFGSLQSVAFGIFYVVACIPLGRIADNGNRKWLLAICLGLWSLFAMASGLARTYWQLFLSRIGVAVGEASLTPAALSMLSDHFPPHKLGRPVAGFLMKCAAWTGPCLHRRWQSACRAHRFEPARRWRPASPGWSRGTRPSSSLALRGCCWSRLSC